MHVVLNNCFTILIYAHGPIVIVVAPAKTAQAVLPRVGKAPLTPLM